MAWIDIINLYKQRNSLNNLIANWYEGDLVWKWIFLSALKITAWPAFHPCNSNIKTLHIYSYLCSFFYFAPPKVMRKHLENLCLFFLLKKTPLQTNQQKESPSCSLKQQMLHLTLRFKGISILVYMSWISWICQYEDSSWQCPFLKVYEWFKKELVYAAVAEEMVVLLLPFSLLTLLLLLFYI